MDMRCRGRLFGHVIPILVRVMQPVQRGFSNQDDTANVGQLTIAMQGAYRTHLSELIAGM